MKKPKTNWGKHRQERRKLKLCEICTDGTKPAPGKRLCAFHLAREAGYKKKARDAKKAKGLCVMPQCLKKRDGSHDRCAHHNELYRLYNRSYYNYKRKR